MSASCHGSGVDCWGWPGVPEGGSGGGGGGGGSDGGGGGEGERGRTTTPSLVKPNVRLRRTPRIAVHVRLRGEPALAVVVGPLLGLSLDHRDKLLATPAFAVPHKRPIQRSPGKYAVHVHSQIVPVIRHLDRLPHDGVFAAVNRSGLERHRRQGRVGFEGRGRDGRVLRVRVHGCGGGARARPGSRFERWGWWDGREGDPCPSSFSLAASV